MHVGRMYRNCQFQFTRAMATNKSDKIAPSPTPPDTDDEGEDIEWPVHGIVGEDCTILTNKHGSVADHRPLIGAFGALLSCLDIPLTRW